MSEITIVEVGPRDGLQNEKQSIPVEIKKQLVEMLASAGLTEIETGSFVSPKWVPQMAASDELFQIIDRKAGVNYSALTPNLRGFEAAVESKVDKVAIFTAASESFCQKNINCSIDESIDRFQPIMEGAKALNIPVRGYVSCVAGCPYEGKVSLDNVMMTTRRLLEIGCYEVSLGDTTGVGTAPQMKQMLKSVLEEFPKEKIAVHYHDTYGQAVANIYASLELGITTFDASVAGLGGCPYAKGASGNVATEDVIYLLEESGIPTGIDLNKLMEAGAFISGALGRATQSKVATARMRSA